jgi:hypothetical protein
MAGACPRGGWGAPKAKPVPGRPPTALSLANFSVPPSLSCGGRSWPKVRPGPEADSARAGRLSPRQSAFRLVCPRRGGVAIGADLGGVAKNRSGTLYLCESWDLRFRTLSREIATCHSSLGGKFGERIDSVKDAEHRLASPTRALQASPVYRTCKIGSPP